MHKHKLEHRWKSNSDARKLIDNKVVKKLSLNKDLVGNTLIEEIGMIYSEKGGYNIANNKILPYF